MSAQAARQGASQRALGVAGLTAALLAALLTGALTLVAGLAIGGAGVLTDQQQPPSALAQSEIPPQYLRLYELAARRYGIDWAILAAIGKVECDHGRDPDPSCTREGVTNYAGAGGPMQFIGSTWQRYGVDSSGDGPPDRWNPADAIYSAANYLRASGAPQNNEAAIFAYNHAGWYVSEVELWAARYRGSAAAAGAAGRQPVTLQDANSALAQGTPTPVWFVAGRQAVLSPGDGHVALIPVEAPPVVQAMIVAGNELQGLRYGPGGHPDPRGAVEEDCSSTVNYVFYRAGVRPIGEILRDNPLAQDYVHWGAPGPGRWVTIYATTWPTDHVFVVVAGLRLDTSHNGTDAGPNSAEDGPRWRLLDHIPGWAPWTVRHPAGL
jgi:Transglycosylase SLT domain